MLRSAGIKRHNQASNQHWPSGRLLHTLRYSGHESFARHNPPVSWATRLREKPYAILEKSYSGPSDRSRLTGERCIIPCAKSSAIWNVTDGTKPRF